MNMTSRMWCGLTLILTGCTSASPFVLEVEGLKRSTDSLSVQTVLPEKPYRIYVTGRGLEPQGEFDPTDFATFSSSLVDSIRENGLYQNVALNHPTEAGPSLEVVLLHHVLAGTSGGLLHIAYRLTIEGQSKNTEITIHCESLSTGSTKDCLNRAAVYVALAELNEMNGGKATPLQSFEEAVYYSSLPDAVGKLPTRLVYVECLMWVTTNYGQECRMHWAHTLDPVPWDKLIKPNEPN